jgi:D-alanyl-D-alanine carboxypeptidase (penicillin-binding protein 5/6)
MNSANIQRGLNPPLNEVSFKLISVLTALLFLGLLLSPGMPSHAAPPQVSADAAILFDAGTGQVLHEKKADKRRAPASLTKIMTAIIALEYGNLEDVVNISGRAAAVGVGSTVDLRRGEQITLENLLKGALITSANDTTVAIAEHVAGSHEGFLRLMNHKALALGAAGTRYANTNGYSHPNHYTTARDLALITRYALNNPRFNRFVSTREDTVHWITGDRKLEIKNTNRLLRDEVYPDIDGVKTGSAIKAGKCLIASATRDHRRLVAVVLHCRNRYQDAVALLDYGFDQVVPRIICRAGAKVAVQPVRGGEKPCVDAVVREEVRVYLDEENVTKVLQKITLYPAPEAPVKKGQVIGEVQYLLNGQKLGSSELVAAEEILPGSAAGRIWYKLTG